MIFSSYFWGHVLKSKCETHKLAGKDAKKNHTNIPKCAVRKSLEIILPFHSSFSHYQSPNFFWPREYWMNSHSPRFGSHFLHFFLRAERQIQLSLPWTITQKWGTTLFLTSHGNGFLLGSYLQKLFKTCFIMVVTVRKEEANGLCVEVIYIQASSEVKRK